MASARSLTVSARDREDNAIYQEELISYRCPIAQLKRRRGSDSE